MKRCTNCFQTKHLEEFGPNLRRTDGRQSHCKECRCGTVKRQAKELRDRVAQIKLDSGCVDCGYNKHPDALQFDHLPGFTKHKSVARLVSNTVGWPTIEQEIAKCEVVCANCHAIRTYERRENKEEQA